MTRLEVVFINLSFVIGKGVNEYTGLTDPESPIVKNR